MQDGSVIFQKVGAAANGSRERFRVSVAWRTGVPGIRNRENYRTVLLYVVASRKRPHGTCALSNAYVQCNVTGAVARRSGAVLLALPNPRAKRHIPQDKASGPLVPWARGAPPERAEPLLLLLLLLVSCLVIHLFTALLQ